MPVTWDTSGSTIFTHSGSNVGIGRVPGAYALDVSGSVNISTGTGVHPSLSINDSMTRFLIMHFRYLQQLFGKQCSVECFNDPDFLTPMINVKIAGRYGVGIKTIDGCRFNAR